MENKPITLSIKESEESLEKLISSSGLPAIVWIYILDRYSYSLNSIAERQYKDDLKKYAERNNNGSED